MFYLPAEIAQISAYASANFTRFWGFQVHCISARFDKISAKTNAMLV
jgi:hypothetical protein